MLASPEVLAAETRLSGKDLPLNKLLNFSVNRDDLLIPDDVREAVLNKLCNAWTKVEGNTKNSFPWDVLRGDIDWQWLTDRGKLPKRIRSFMHKEFKFEVSDNIVGQIGDICLDELPATQKYYFDISDNLVWRSGDFGDHSSCFTNPNGKPSSSVEKMSETGDFLALRFFRPFGTYDPDVTSVTQNNVSYVEDDKLFLGTSRAWLYAPSEDKTLLFNSYGYNTATSADIFSRYLEIPKKWVAIQGTGLHINGCGGYILDPKGYKPNSYEMDFWTNGYYDDGDGDEW
jgi:hypothetical protein